MEEAEREQEECRKGEQEQPPPGREGPHGVEMRCAVVRTKEEKKKTAVKDKTDRPQSLRTTQSRANWTLEMVREPTWCFSLKKAEKRHTRNRLRSPKSPTAWVLLSAPECD